MFEIVRNRRASIDRRQAVVGLILGFAVGKGKNYETSIIFRGSMLKRKDFLKLRQRTGNGDRNYFETETWLQNDHDDHCTYEDCKSVGYFSPNDVLRLLF